MGLFAIRPTHSLERLHGIIPLSRYVSSSNTLRRRHTDWVYQNSDLDTPGLACREAQLFHQVSAHLFGPLNPKTLRTETSVTVADTLPEETKEPCQTNSRNGKGWRNSLSWLRPRELLDTSRPSAALPQSTCPPSPEASQLTVLSEFKPTNLLYPLDYWKQWSGKPVTDKMEEAVSKLEQYLDVKRKPVDLQDMWLKRNPLGTLEPLKTYLQDVRDR